MTVGSVAKGIRHVGMFVLLAWSIFILQSIITSHVFAPYEKPHEPYVSVSTVSANGPFPSMIHILASIRSQVIYLLTVVKFG